MVFLFSLISLFIFGFGYFTYIQLENDSLLKIREDADELFLALETKLEQFIVKEETRDFSSIKDKPNAVLLGHFELVESSFKTNFYNPGNNQFKDEYERLSSVLATMKFERVVNSDLKSDIELIQNSVKNYERVPNYDGASKGAKGKSTPRKLKGFRKSKKYIPIERREYTQGRYISLISNQGHLLLLRSLIINDKRALQGAVYLASALLNTELKKEFYNRNLSDFSQLEIWSPSKLLYRIGEREGLNRYSIERNLEALISGLRLNLQITSIPASPSFKFLVVILILVLLVVSASFLFIYRSGLAQIDLAEQRSNFVSAVGHELKTPLTSISMYTEMLKEDMVQDDNQKNDYYDFISQETQRLSRLINNILKLSKINRNVLSIEPEQVSSSQLRNLIQRKTEKLVHSRGFKLKIEMEDCQYDLDIELFTQVFFNVIENALKFAKDAKSKSIEIKLAPAKITIRDYGPGVTPEKVDKIFTMFYRAESELTRTTSGTGIGLSLVRQIVELHGGKIKARNMNPGLEVEIIF